MYKGSKLYTTLLSKKTLNLLPFIRQLTNEVKNEHLQCHEVRIPVPWGHIAGKWWGPTNKRPLLAIHGWQDNAGTFDRLVPYLPSNTPILAIDLPGHGLSSRIPKGIMYMSTDVVRWVHQIVQYFRWPKVTLLGHSMGGVIGALYSLYYSDMVDFLICIDSIKPVTLRENTTENVVKYVRSSIEMFLKYDALGDAQPPAYTWEECEKLVAKGQGGSVALEFSKYLLKRNVAPCKDDSNKFYFTRDPRVKAFFIVPLSHEQILELYKNLTRPILIMKTDKGSYYDKKEKFYEVVDVIKRSSADCRFVHVLGTHHVHLNTPEAVEGHINNFLREYDVKDRTFEMSGKKIFV